MRDHVHRNRREWDRESAAYQRAHHERLLETPTAWGVWRIPESQLGVLGSLEGREVLELGCGGAQWTLALLEAGVRAQGVDVSIGQLRHAQRDAQRRGLDARLTLADAEHLPYRDESFDVVFCDHGATSFTDPLATIPEVARVLRPGGLLAFCNSSPLRDACCRPDTGEPTNSLQQDYFGMRALPSDDGVCFQLPYGEWLRLFARCGLSVEDLIELQRPADARTTYTGYVDADWASRWPAENIWKLRKGRT